MERLLKDKHPLSVNALAAGTSQKKEYCAIGIPDPKEKQEQDKGKHISKNIHQAPLHFCIREPGSENSTRTDFQKHYFENTEGLKELCRKTLKDLVGEASDNTNNTSNDKVVEMFLNYGSNILGVLYKYGSSKAQKSNGRVAQTLIDMLEKQIPFPVLFELHKLKQGYGGDKLKQGYGGDVSLLNALILLVKNCFEIEVSKLTPLNADPCKCKYKPEYLPKHLLELVHSLCIPTSTRSDEYCGLVLQQIKTATELKNNGVSFEKNDEEHTLFDIHFKEGTMKIRGFRIDEFTETFLIRMIAYEQHPDNDAASKYFTDFVLFMSKLINTPKDAELLSGIINNFHGTDRVQLFSELRKGVKTSSTSTFSGVIKKQEENQTHDIGKYISRVPEALSQTNPSAYKPKLISIGPYYRIREPGSENRIKNYFQEGFFGNTVGLEEQCRVKLTSFVDMARSCYAGSTKDISNVGLVEMLMRDGCFILQFLKSVKDKKSRHNGTEAQTFMENQRKVVQTLEDMLLLENQIPFFVLFELHKLKQDKGDDVALLKELIELVKNCYEIHVLKLTQPLLPCKYKPEKLPKHLLEVVYSLCIPTNTTRSDEYKKCGLVLQQINTATELEKNGVSFQKIEEVQSSLFGIDFNWGTMKIRRFRIDDFTETLLRNMIAYEQHSDVESKYFTDFVLFMSHLIDTPEDVKLLRGKGIIAIFPATDDKEKFFSQLLVGVNTSSPSTLSTLSGVINKVSQHCEKQLAIWLGMLRQDFTNSPWKPILGFIAVIAAVIGIVHHIITSAKAH